MRSHSTILLALLVAAACGGDDEVTIDAAGLEVDGAPAPDAAPPDAGAADAGSNGASVTWSPDLPNPYIIPAPGDDPDFGGVAIDYFLQYTVELPDPNVPAAVLEIEICSQPAGQPEPACTSNVIPAVAGDGGYRWGIDPSTYAVGFNVFEHTLTILQGETVRASAVLRYEVTATR